MTKITTLKLDEELVDLIRKDGARYERRPVAHITYLLKQLYINKVDILAKNIND